MMTRSFRRSDHRDRRNSRRRGPTRSCRVARHGQADHVRLRQWRHRNRSRRQRCHGHTRLAVDDTNNALPSPFRGRMCRGRL